MERSKRILYTAAALSVGAALAHVWVMPQHFEEWWGYGAFFLVAAAAQGIYGVVLLRWPGSPLFVAGVAGNLAIVILYLVTRTAGVPLLGPHAGEVEGIGAIDLIATASEVALIAALVALLRSAPIPGAVEPVQAAEPARAGESVPALSRRDFLRAAGVVGALGISGGALGAHANRVYGNEGKQHGQHGGGREGAGSPAAGGHGGNGVVGDVDLSRFDPTKFLRDSDYGEERKEGGRTVREWELTAEDVEIEVAPGVFYPAWAYNGQVPGPTLRATEGDRLRVVFKNRGTHPHTIHFHGFHPANMDGVFEQVGPGQEFVYEFDAEPFGMHLYHCHTMPLKKHIEKGLYGAFIVDPKEGRPPADEMVMVLNGFDTNFDAANEVYAVNTVAFHHQRHPIKIKKGELIRIYVANLLEFDFINSFHTHANFFNYYPTGTKLEPSEFTDTKMFGQGERGIMEFRYNFPGLFMFHAHVSEFAELGWMGFFEVEE
jgi:FtsP/CotA-like multicopper oxidase with cupredoxin domain